MKTSPINYEDILRRIDTRVMALLENDENLAHSDFIHVSKTVANYMTEKEIITKSRRNTVQEISTFLNQKYEKAFSRKNSDNGIPALRDSILNNLQYKKGKLKSENVGPQIPVSYTDKDEYGFVEYNPPLPTNETSATQEKKRILLLNEFEALRHESLLITDLNSQTYPTQRALLIDSNRNLIEITTNWPFLKNVSCLINHCTRLLGKDVRTIWYDFFNDRYENIGLYFIMNTKIFINQNEKYEEVMKNFQEARQNSRGDVSKRLVIFPLLALYFEEELEYFCTIMNVST